MQSFLNAGAGGAIAGLIVYLLYRLVSRLAESVGSRMVAAFEHQAAAIARQATSMEGMTHSIEEWMGRDSTEHREMLVLLRYIAQQQQAFEEVRVEHNLRKEQANTHCAVKPA